MTAPEGDSFAPDWVCLGVITGAQGIKGEVRVKTFTELPEAIGDYGPVTGRRSGRSLVLSVTRPIKGGVAARIEGVADRTAAEALKGEQLYVARSVLPAPDDEDTFYHADLLGCVADDEAGGRVGTLRAVYDFGAGDMLEIALEDEGARDRVILLPFTRAAVPEVDLERRRVVVSMAALATAKGKG